MAQLSVELYSTADTASVAVPPLVRFRLASCVRTVGAMLSRAVTLTVPDLTLPFTSSAITVTFLATLTLLHSRVLGELTMLSMPQVSLANGVDEAWPVLSRDTSNGVDTKVCFCVSMTVTGTTTTVDR